MAWDFDTDPELHERLGLAEPLDHIRLRPCDVLNPLYAKRALPLQATAKKEAA